MSELKNGWDKVKSGDTMKKDNTKYTILVSLGDVIAYCNPGDISNVAWGRSGNFKNAGWNIVGAEWERAEDAISYLQSKGLIKDGKVITS